MTAPLTLYAVAETSAPMWPGDPGDDLCLYRDRTVALLKRYARGSVELGRLPSLLGREFFRARVTSYNVSSFEEVVIFVHDVERALEKLGALEQKLIAMNVLEEYSQAEIAQRMGCSKRWVEAQLPIAIDEVTSIFLESGLMNAMAHGETRQKSCQEGKTGDFAASHSGDGKNKGNN